MTAGTEHSPVGLTPRLGGKSWVLRVFVGLWVAGTGWGHYVTRIPRAAKLVGLVKPWAVRRRTCRRLLVLIWRVWCCCGWELGFHVGDMSLTGAGMRSLALVAEVLDLVFSEVVVVGFESGDFVEGSFEALSQRFG